MSHNSMGAFYSQTDNNNDKTGVYYSGVVGKLTPRSYDTIFRFNLYEAKIECKIGDIFDIEETKLEIDPTWLSKISPPTTLPVTHSRHSSQMYDVYGAPLKVSNFDKDFGAGRSMAGHPIYDFDGPDYGQQAFMELGGVTIESTKKQEGKDLKTQKKSSKTKDVIVPGPQDKVIPEMLPLEDLNGYGELYGMEAEQAFQIVDDFLVALESADDALEDIVNQCVNLMTSSGKAKLMTSGLQ